MADRKIEKSGLSTLYEIIASLKTLSSEAISLLVSILSVAIALASFYTAHNREASTDLRNSTRDWQKGLVFSTLLGSGQPLTIDDIESRYRSSAVAARDRFKLSDKEFSREEIYSVLLDLLSNGSVKLRDAKHFFRSKPMTTPPKIGGRFSTCFNLRSAMNINFNLITSHLNSRIGIRGSEAFP